MGNAARALIEDPSGEAVAAYVVALEGAAAELRERASTIRFGGPHAARIAIDDAARELGASVRQMVDVAGVGKARA